MRNAGLARALVAAAALCGLAGCTPQRSPSELSVVLITLDTTRADRIGAFGGTTVRTPHLDRLAREGVAFMNAISQVPLTLPAHSSILTGLYPASHGVRHNGIYRLPEAQVSLAERLKEAGFATAAVIGAFVLNRAYGTDQGFDQYDEIDLDGYQRAHDNQYEAQRTAEEVNARVFDWLARRPAGRFFLWVHYYDPHHPYAPPADTSLPLQGSGYDREISYLDACVGQLVERLRADGVLGSTLLVVVGDHGESLGEHREVTHGVFLYDAAVRVPLIVRAPGVVPDGVEVEAPVEIVDIAPSVLDLLDLTPAAPMQGRTLVPLMRGERVPVRPVFAETFMPRLEFGWSELRMVRSGNWKYIQAPRPELYDLAADPGELSNLVANEPERAREMAALVSDWVASTSREDAERQATNLLTPEDEARLRSLGYLGGDAFRQGTSGELPDPKDRVDEALLLNEARDLLTAGNAAGALPLLDRLLQGGPRNHLARSSKVQALVALRRYPEAEQEALAALADATADPEGSALRVEKARRALASILWMLGRNREAEEQYRLAVELNRTNKSAPVFPGLLLGVAGGKAEAMRIVDDVLSRNPRDGAALAARFELLLAENKDAEALVAARRLVGVQGADADTLLKAGKLARDTGDARLASGLFEQADQRQPRDPDILGYLGTARLAAGDLAGAERALSTVRQLRPRDPRAPFYLGNIALLRGDEKSARALFDEALRADPDFTPPLHSLALWLADRGRTEEARRALEDAVRRNEKDEKARVLLQQLAAASRSAPPG